MKLGNYAVQIQGGLERDNGYVEMTHNTKYAILLSNDSELNCDAVVEIDGKQVGIWRVSSAKDIQIERPVHDTGLFTFYKLDSSESRKIGLVRNDNLGLISVLFKPEKPPIPVDFDLSMFDDENAEFDGDVEFDLSSFDDDDSYSAGGTGLSGKSEQKFIDVKALDYNESAFVQIHLRLICKEEAPRPLTPISTQIPPPLR